jgi:hypothetical protein
VLRIYQSFLTHLHWRIFNVQILHRNARTSPSQCHVTLIIRPYYITTLQFEEVEILTVKGRRANQQQSYPSPREAVLFQSFCQPHHCLLCSLCSCSPSGSTLRRGLKQVLRVSVRWSIWLLCKKLWRPVRMLFTVIWSPGSDGEAGAAVELRWARPKKTVDWAQNRTLLHALRQHSAPRPLTTAVCRIRAGTIMGL